MKLQQIEANNSSPGAKPLSVTDEMKEIEFRSAGSESAQAAMERQGLEHARIPRSVAIVALGGKLHLSEGLELSTPAIWMPMTGTDTEPSISKWEIGESEHGGVPQNLVGSGGEVPIQGTITCPLHCM